MRFDLSDLLILAGVALMLVYLYLLVGWFHLMGILAAILVIIGVRLAQWQRSGGK